MLPELDSGEYIWKVLLRIRNGRAIFYFLIIWRLTFGQCQIWPINYLLSNVET